MKSCIFRTHSESKTENSVFGHRIVVDNNKKMENFIFNLLSCSNYLIPTLRVHFNCLYFNYEVYMLQKKFFCHLNKVKLKINK